MFEFLILKGFMQRLQRMIWQLIRRLRNLFAPQVIIIGKHGHERALKSGFWLSILASAVLVLMIISLLFFMLSSLV